MTTSRGILQEAEQKFTFVSRSNHENFSMNHSSLLSRPTSSPASHVVSTSSAAASAKSESWDLNRGGSTQQEYLSQSHFSIFLSMEIQLLIIFANKNLHLKTKQQFKKFLLSSVFIFPFSTFPPSHLAYQVLTFPQNSFNS